MPRAHTYIAATPATPTQKHPTLDLRVDWNQPLRPTAGRSQLLVLPQGAESIAYGRYLCGIVLDCHGARSLSGEGATAALVGYKDVYPEYFVGYWDKDQQYHVDHTYLGGTFCAHIGDTASSAPPAGGQFFITVDDAVSQERRIQSWINVPSDGDAAIVLFPPTLADIQNQ